MSDTPGKIELVQNKNWSMYHGDYTHGGNAGIYNPLKSSNVNDKDFGLIHSINTPGSILSVPAIVDGYIYVGLANSREAKGSNGGTIQKYKIDTGKLEGEFTWSIDVVDRDIHGFTGMGCTPTVINGMLYFIGFDAKVYCLDTETLTQQWVIDLRYADPNHNQPITNTIGMETGFAPVEGWSSPTVVMIGGKPKVFVGIGEGENPYAHSFIYSLDGETGDVDWIYSTGQFEAGKVNAVNEIPEEVLLGDVPAMFTVFKGPLVTLGCSVWSSIAYDEETGNLYASTGQPASAVIPDIDLGLPTIGWSSGILALNATTGEHVAFTQMPAETSYRTTDLDVDIGSAPTIYTLPVSPTNPTARRVIGVGCKNGGFMVCDLPNLELINSVCLLPFYKNGEQIPTVDPHPIPSKADDLNPATTNEESNANYNENYSGPFNTAAIDPITGVLFVGIGGPNYHNASPGIDHTSTPFMKAIKWDTLEDAWPMDDSFDPPRYKNVGESMYSSAGESGLSSPAVANDVVFVTTSKISIYAFNVADGSLLWSAPMGSPTDGLNGGYGYCMGPAIWGEYVVAGSLIQGLEGGVLNIYGLKS
jgi:outer membrane protein assembly factor BamB